MPKISGPNIAQHVADQEAAVFEAATRLFTERGVDDVSMGAIADEVGLARPSLYRYFGTKSAIIVRWFEQAITPLIVESDLIARSDDDRSTRFDRWIEHQIEFLLDPSNRAMIRASLAATDLGSDQLQLIGRRHRELYESLRAIVVSGENAEHGTTVDDEALKVRIMQIVDLIRGMGQMTDDGTSVALAGAEVLRASRLIAGMDSL